MSRPDVTKLLAESWHSLPHEDGRPRRLMHLSQFGQSDDNKQRIQGLCIDLADCVQHLLETHGYRITHRDDVQPADVEDYKTAHIKCACGASLLDLNVSPDMTATLGKAARTYAATRLRSDCPHA